MSKSKGGKGQAAVAYYRVSTRAQGDSGLGLDAQRSAVERFARDRRLRIAAEYRDVESGRHNARPGLAAALARAKAEGATLVIAKLDRLSRNAAFILTLRDSGVPFVACDMPEANTLTVGLMAVLAQQEAELISARTKAALAELRRKGKRLGTDNLSDAARKKAASAKREAALAFHNGTIRHACNYRRAGWTLRQIAEELNAAGAVARRGGRFTATTVARLLKLGGV